MSPCMTMGRSWTEPEPVRINVEVGGGVWREADASERRVPMRHSEVGLPATSMDPEDEPACSPPERPVIRMDPDEVPALTSPGAVRFNSRRRRRAEAWPRGPPRHECFPEAVWMFGVRRVRGKSRPCWEWTQSRRFSTRMPPERVRETAPSMPVTCTSPGFIRPSTRPRGER